jgi:hypothetical protein
MSNVTLRPLLFNAIGYFCAPDSTDIRRYLSQSQDARVTRSPDLISIPGYSRDSQPADLTIYTLTVPLPVGTEYV